MPIEKITRIADRSELENFIAENSFLTLPEYVRSIVAHGLEHGVVCPVIGAVKAEDVSVRGVNYRETFVTAGLSPRHRAIFELLAVEPWFEDIWGARIYAAEALTPFALRMRGRFARFIGSEFASSAEDRSKLYPIEAQDLQNLQLPSGRFDCVITNDCLEHVPEIPPCLSEMHRILKPGGVMLATFPFTNADATLVKARLVDGRIEHFAEPEYHENPVDPEGGSLVFQIPGWDILEQARAAGFSRAEMVFVSSINAGITAAEQAGILAMRCYA